jgi:hypothetical protein
MNIYFAKTLVSTNTTIGISALNKDLTNWSIYPNPAKEFFSIEVDKSWIGESVSIFSLSGKLLAQKKIYASINIIDIKDLESGEYLIVLGDNVKKLVKK